MFCLFTGHRHRHFVCNIVIYLYHRHRHSPIHSPSFTFVILSPIPSSSVIYLYLHRHSPIHSPSFTFVIRSPIPSSSVIHLYLRHPGFTTNNQPPFIPGPCVCLSHISKTILVRHPPTQINKKNTDHGPRPLRSPAKGRLSDRRSLSTYIYSVSQCGHVVWFWVFNETMRKIFF